MTPPPTTLTETLFAQAGRVPDKLAFSIDTGESIRFGELGDQVRKWSGALRRLGLQEGGRCAIVLPTGLDFLLTLFGAQAAGGAPAAIPSFLPSHTILRRIASIDCDVAVCDAATASSLAGQSERTRLLTPDEIRRELENGRPADMPRPTPDSIAFLQFTSGTTGESRAAVLRHRQVMSYLRERNTFRNDEVMVSWLPLYHDLGLVRFVLGAVFDGFSSHLLQPSLRNLRAWLETIDRVGGTVSGSADFGYRVASRAVDPEGLDLSTLYFLISGGEAVRVSTIEQFESRFGIPGRIMPGYGLAEATLAVSTMIPGLPRRIDERGNISCGRPGDSLELRISGPDDGPLPAGKSGEILVRGNQVFSGYFNDHDGTTEVLRGGWLHTGDVGYLDREGFLFVLGRKRAMIKRAGSAIAPREVEESVDALPFVRLSAAIGAPDMEGTERLVIVVEVDGNREPLESLARQVSERIGETMGFAPDEVLLVPRATIPLTHNGKLRYGALRDAYLAGSLPTLEDQEGS